jgi:hypothetical protein
VACLLFLPSPFVSGFRISYGVFAPERDILLLSSWSIIVMLFIGIKFLAKVPYLFLILEEKASLSL